MKITTKTAKQTVKELLKENKNRRLYLATVDVKVGKERKMKNYFWTIYEDQKKLKKALKASVLNAECMDNYEVYEKQLKEFPMVYNYSYNDPFTEWPIKIWITVTKIN